MIRTPPRAPSVRDGRPSGDAGMANRDDTPPNGNRPVPAPPPVPVGGAGEVAASLPLRLPLPVGLAYLQQSTSRCSPSPGSRPVAADEGPPPEGTIGYENVQAADV